MSSVSPSRIQTGMGGGAVRRFLRAAVIRPWSALPRSGAASSLDPALTATRSRIPEPDEIAGSLNPAESTHGEADHQARRSHGLRHGRTTTRVIRIDETRYTKWPDYPSRL